MDITKQAYLSIRQELNLPKTAQGLNG